MWPSMRQHRHSTVQVGEMANILRVRGTALSYGALEMIAVVHLFCYPKEETTALIAEWNGLESSSLVISFFEWYSSF